MTNSPQDITHQVEALINELDRRAQEIDLAYEQIRDLQSQYRTACEARDEARELAAMYLQCMNSRAIERGETEEP
jgi:hypothetical protein